MSELSLVARLRAGERAAFDEIAQHHGRNLRATALRLVKCPETAAELVQDVMFRLWRDREDIVIREHVTGYLRRAVRNRALDYLKRQRIETRWIERELSAIERDPGRHRAEHGAEAAMSAEWDHVMQQALDALPPKRRAAVLLRWRDGLSYQEIAAALGVSPKTVENQIGRGLKTLRMALARETSSCSEAADPPFQSSETPAASARP